MEAPVVLVVDDDKLIRWSVSAVLGRAGYCVVEASSAAEGLAAVRRAAPDLVLLDVSLPDADGFAVLTAIRRSHPKLPVLMMTADATSETARQALLLGASGHLDKPCDASLLEAAISRALQSSSYS